MSFCIHTGHFELVKRQENLCSMLCDLSDACSFYSGDPKAQPYTLTQGKLLAMVAVDVLCNPGLVDTMKAQLQEALEKGEWWRARTGCTVN